MLKNLISQGDFALWPQISLVLFLAVFSAILVWTFRIGSKRHYEAMGNLVLEDDPKGGIHHE